MSPRRLTALLAAAAWRGLAAPPLAASTGPCAALAAAAAGAQARRWRSAAPTLPAHAAAAAATPRAPASDGPSTSAPSSNPGADDAVYGGQTLAAIRARIFGTHIGDGRPSGRKLLRRALIGPAVAAYYPSDPAALDPLYVDVDDTRRVAKLERMRRRGKAPPKKGEGKRAGKKKR